MSGFGENTGRRIKIAGGISNGDPAGSHCKGGRIKIIGFVADNGHTRSRCTVSVQINLGIVLGSPASQCLAVCRIEAIQLAIYSLPVCQQNAICIEPVDPAVNGLDSGCCTGGGKVHGTVFCFQPACAEIRFIRIEVILYTVDGDPAGLQSTGLFVEVVILIVDLLNAGLYSTIGIGIVGDAVYGTNTSQSVALCIEAMILAVDADHSLGEYAVGICPHLAGIRIDPAGLQLLVVTEVILLAVDRISSGYGSLVCCQVVGTVFGDCPAGCR